MSQWCIPTHPPRGKGTSRLFWSVVDAAPQLQSFSLRLHITCCSFVIEGYQLRHADTSFDTVARLIWCLTFLALLGALQELWGQRNFDVLLGKMPTTFLTRCDVRPCLPDDTAQHWSGPGALVWILGVPRGLGWIASCIFTSWVQVLGAGVPGQGVPRHGVLGTPLPSWRLANDTVSPAFRGMSWRASSMYLKTAEDFHRPSVPISWIGSPLLAYHIVCINGSFCPKVFNKKK